jgi:hypothetical protein
MEENLGAIYYVGNSFYYYSRVWWLSEELY